MKVAAFLFSIYVLMLSCMPCNDRDECNRFPPIQTRVSAATHDNHKHDMENCTPFCHCSCCAAAMAHPYKNYFQQIKLAFPSGQYSIYKVLYTSRAPASIWQPPKLS